MFVNANKEIVSYEDFGLDIKDVTLLSAEEYSQYADIIQPVNFWWWLRSPGYYLSVVTCVIFEGLLGSSHVDDSSLCVRPALICESTGLTPGTKLRMLDLRWTVLNESLILCDESIGCSAFRVDSEASDANVYKTSDVKKFIQNWIAKEVINNA